MKQHVAGENQVRSRSVRAPTCDHHFHVVHVAGRVIPGVMVCESCGQHIVHRKKAPTSDVN
jgi:hypothetical protein